MTVLFKCMCSWCYAACSHRIAVITKYFQNELKEGAQRSVPKQYYYVDYQHFCNVVKWRIAKMRSIIDSTLRNVSRFLHNLTR